jgi:peptidyl-prolyl cis-trans isomerase A (cyclophilin A)
MNVAAALRWPSLMSCIVLSGVVTTAFACSKAPPEPITRSDDSQRAVPTVAKTAAAVVKEGEQGWDTESNRSMAAALAPPSSVALNTPAAVAISPDDPLKGVFTLATALAGLPATGDLHATLDTSKGAIECKLFDSKAPNTVANFVGLARGLRPWKDPKGAWVKRPAFDGTKFHRVIPDFMIQGGDAKGNGSGEPGYVIADELWAGARHDRAGLLCMANRGPDTNGAQFFITDKAASHLDVSYTIFGECAPTGIVHDIATVPRDPRDMPLTEVTIRSIKIMRRPAAAAAASAARH